MSKRTRKQRLQRERQKGRTNDTSRCRSVLVPPESEPLRCQLEVDHEGQHVHRQGDHHLWWEHKWSNDGLYVSEYTSGGED